MRLSTLFAAIAACCAFSTAHASCTAASIKGAFAVGGAGEYYDSGVAAFGIGRISFDGIRAIAVTTYKEGYGGGIATYTGSGTYTLDSYCRGSGTITLKQNGVVVATDSISFMVSGTAANPEIAALLSNPTNRSSGLAYFKKINL